MFLNRLLEHIAPNILPEFQCGLGRDGHDFYSATVTGEGQELGLYQCFIDLTKAFDRVTREAHWKILSKLRCPKKWFCLIRSMYVLVGVLDRISAEAGVKQGDILAPTSFAILFAMVFLRAFKDSEIGIYIWYRTTGKFNFCRFDAVTKMFVTFMRDFLYADDCNLITHSEGDLQLLMDCFSVACDGFCLTISLKKTVVMYKPAPVKPVFLLQFMPTARNENLMADLYSRYCSTSKDQSPQHWVYYHETLIPFVWTCCSPWEQSDA